MKKIVDELNNKRILIWGYGREGKATENFIKSYCTAESLKVYEGERDGFNADDYDLIIKSPGIPYFTDDKRFTSETKLFLMCFRDRTIGITGTKGKSTTASLMYEALKAAGKKTVLLGNIGRPCFDEAPNIDEDTFIVFELSCHQLSDISLAPKYSVFLNLFEEHLDYYKTFERYFLAKANIVNKQLPGDVSLIGENVPEIKSESKQIRIKDAGHDIKLTIPGKHNVLNAEFVYAMAVDILGLDPEKVRQGLHDFKGLPHRLQFVTEKGNVKYYDDSISTIPEASISAVCSIENVKTVLIGGMDRGIDYDILLDFIKERQDVNFILMYDTGKRIYESVRSCKNVFLTKDLEEAVKCAKEKAAPGTAVVLSPAAASYGFFKNFEERGDRFRELVLED